MPTADTLRRRASAAAAALGIALLAACGDAGPTRDGAGTISEAGEARLLTLRAGDCVGDLRRSFENPDGGRNGVPLVRAVPCAEPHDAEVLLVSQLGGGAWPGPGIVDGEAARGRSALRRRVAAAGSGVTLFTFSPTEARWDFEDQHEIVYLVLYERPRRGTLAPLSETA